MGRIGKAIFYMSALAAGGIGGAASAYLVVNDARLVGKQEAGGWTTNSKIGAAAADPYTRAVVARRGLLALNRSEVAYFQRLTDDAGRPLREGCEYRMSGGRLPARWWGITIYAEDDFLPRNGSQAYSVEQTGVMADTSGSWSAVLSRERPRDAANWLSTRNAGTFLLTLRMYHPSPAALDNLEALQLPRIERLSCEEGAA